MYRRLGALILGVTLLFAVGAVISAEPATPPVGEDVEVHIGPLHIVVPDGKDDVTPDHFQHTTPQRVYMLYDPVRKRYLSAGKSLGGFNFWTDKNRASVWISKKEAERAVSLMFGTGRRAVVHAFVLLPVHLRDGEE